MACSGNTAADILGSLKTLRHVLLTMPVFGSVRMRVDGYLANLFIIIGKENEAHGKEIYQTANPC